MVADQVTGPYPPFDYGTPVRWRRGTGTVLEGSICGFREISDTRTAAVTGLAEGTVLALVEIRSGESVEIPLKELELL
jgi:hypothetical protein